MGPAKGLMCSIYPRYRKHNKTWKKSEKDGCIPLTKDLIESIEINVTLQNSGKDKLTPVFE